MGNIEAQCRHGEMARKFRTLVVHVGDMKTGTTSIQAALAAGNIPDVGRKVIYPGDALNHNDLSPALAAPPGRGKKETAELRNLIEAQEDADICIISAEALSRAMPARVARRIETNLAEFADEIRVLHYVRPHFGFILSRYVEAVKNGVHIGDLESWVDRLIEAKRHLTYDRVSRWHNAFGDAYAVRPFIRSELTRGDAIADFYTQVFGELPEDWVIPPSTNETLPQMAVQMLLKFQQQIDVPDAIRSPLGRQFAMRFNEMFGGRFRDKVEASAEIAQRIHDACADDAAALDRDYFGGRPLFAGHLDRDLDLALKGRPATIEEISPDDMIRLLGQLITDITKGVNGPRVGERLHGLRSQELVAAAKFQD